MKRILFAAVYILFCVMGLNAQSPSEQIRENYVQVIKRLKGELTEREQTLQKAYTDLEQMTQKSSIESQNKWIEVLQADIASLKRQIAQTEQRKAQEEANADRLQQELEKRVKEAQQKHRQQQAVQAKQAEAKAAAQKAIAAFKETPAPWGFLPGVFKAENKLLTENRNESVRSEQSKKDWLMSVKPKRERHSDKDKELATKICIVILKSMFICTRSLKRKAKHILLGNQVDIAQFNPVRTRVTVRI